MSEHRRIGDLKPWRCSRERPIEAVRAAERDIDNEFVAGFNEGMSKVEPLVMAVARLLDHYEREGKFDLGLLQHVEVEWDNWRRFMRGRSGD